MPDDRFDTGMRVRRSVLGDKHVDGAVARQTPFDTDFQRFITEGAWGSVWSRPGLDKRTRSLLVIALMAALGHEEELAMHINATRNTGATPDDAVAALSADAHTAVIALTHDPKLDDLALMEALRSPAFYVGAIGSRVNQAKRKQRLAEHFGLSAEELDRLHGPVGIKNGARTPPEIAVSILARLIAVRRSAG